MAQPRILEDVPAAVGPGHARDALGLAKGLPYLALEARRAAANVAAGLHGRRRAGSGEAFWQFRPLGPGEAAGRVDWRRSARDDRATVREREWEAPRAVRLWIDRSASMAYASSLASASKLDRAVVLALAAAEVLTRGGEKVGLLGGPPPQASRRIVERLAERLAMGEAALLDAAAEPLPPLSEAILVGDFLTPAPRVTAALERLAARGARGHLVMVADPVEEIFPFAGNLLLVEPEGGMRLRVGEAGAFRSHYAAKLAAHREAIRAACARLGWSLLLHRTDASAAGALMPLLARVAARDGAGARA